jgi:hypothetical protein
MRFVDRTAPGKLELNFMWLPTWVGMNEALIRELEQELSKTIVGKDLTEELLDEAHQTLLQLLVTRFPNAGGLFEYLEGIKFVENNGS